MTTSKTLPRPPVPAPSSSVKRIFVLAGKVEPFGGIETHVSCFCAGLANRGLEVTLALTSKRLHPDLTTALTKAGVVVAQFDCVSNPFRRLPAYLSSLRFALESRPHLDALYTHGRSGFAWLLGALLSPRLWIHHHHEDARPDALPSLPFLYRRLLRRVDWLIACTPNHALSLDRCFHRQHRTVALPYLKSEPHPPFLHRAEPAPNSPLVVAYFGRLLAAKGVPILLDLAPWFLARSIDCRLHGTDSEGLLARGTPHGISWRGPYNPHTDLDGLLRDVDLVVLPTSFYEGLPIVMSEAISRGVPVLAFNAGGLRDVHGLHPGLAVVAPNVDTLKAEILRLATLARQPGFRAGLADFYRRHFGNPKAWDWWNITLGLQAAP